MKSTSGLSICPRNCRAYADSDSTYRRCPSAKIVSNARLDFPDPDNPVNTIIASRGKSSETSFKLCSRAPRTTRRSATFLQALNQRGGQRRPRRSATDKELRVSTKRRRLGFPWHLGGRSLGQAIPLGPNGVLRIPRGGPAGLEDAEPGHRR